MIKGYPPPHCAELDLAKDLDSCAAPILEISACPHCTRDSGSPSAPNVVSVVAELTNLSLSEDVGNVRTSTDVGDVGTSRLLGVDEFSKVNHLDIKRLDKNHVVVLMLWPALDGSRRGLGLHSEVVDIERLYWDTREVGLASGRACWTCLCEHSVTNVTSLINLRVAFHAINARRLPLAPLVYTLVRPPMTTSSANNSVFRGFFEKQKLTGPNFIDWYRQLRIVLSIEDKLNYLEHPIPHAPVAPEEELKTQFAQQADQELLQTTRDFHSCKQEEGQSVSSYVLKMKGYIGNLQCLGHPVTLGLAYLAELLKKKKNTALGAGGSGIFTIELNTFLNRSWIYDTGCCGIHICNATQGLRASRKLKPGALSLYVGNGQREAVEAIVVFYLCLPSGLEIILNNFHYAPSITRGLIFVSRLYEDGFINRFVNNTIQVSRNNMVYFSAIPRDGVFEIDLSNSNANDSSIYTISNKRAKLDLDSALLWHCRKRIEKLQHDGLLNSTDLRAFEKCVSCMFGKMARKPYTHQMERAKDLLGLIHTDHKHEVFETFKVFQKEVENQLGKTIKWLRSDHGGEYMSQEFLDHLKDHGIIAHRTPPYTPQHNGVSERRNRTLLDMVRSMMSQTTLPKSFWDYALETAARILNMVPTKKVEKTPYE
ncbi:retrotransposon protein, putative, ty1-copia subclass, partial [Tanacetum coccineum]